MTTTYAHHTPAPLAWSSPFKALHDRWNRRNLYRRTLSELSALSDRELDDIGLNRSSLESVVYHATYEAR